MKTEGASLGVNGKGKAPHWRLTDRRVFKNNGHIEQPTQDFLRWDGTLFEPHRAPSRLRKKQNPGLTVESTVDSPLSPLPAGVIAFPSQGGLNGESISVQASGLNGESISRLATGTASPGGGRVVALARARRTKP